MTTALLRSVASMACAVAKNLFSSRSSNALAKQWQQAAWQCGGVCQRQYQSAMA
jgi:hypothetical protein